MSSRCLLNLLVASVLLGTLVVVPSAQAQLVPAFTLSIAAVDADVYPGEVAIYDIEIGNPSAVLAREARLNNTLPKDWSGSFSVDPVAIAAGSTNTTRWSISVPTTAAPGTYVAMVEAADDWNFTRANVTVTVRAPPAGTTQPPASAAPDITLTTSTGDSAQSGANASGTLTVVNRELARTVTVAISISPAGGWTPSIPSSDQNRVLTPGASATARLGVPIPALTETTTNTFTVTVVATTADGVSKTYSAFWTVTGEPKPASEPAPSTSQNSTSPSSGGTSTRTPVSAQFISNLDVYVAPLEVEVPTGGTQVATVQLRNAGNVPLTVTLSSQPPPSWAPFTFPNAVIELPASSSADVPMTIVAPENLPPGGTAPAKVYAVAEGGNLVRTADFVIKPTIGAPRDTTDTATVEAPAAPDGGFAVQAPSTLVVAGLATVGAAAAVVASRPLREKLLWVGAGLYTRLARPDVLGHEDRERLYRLVETTPGIHFHALQRDLAWNTGTLTYHLRVLERHGFLVSRRDGLYRRFYLSGAAPRKEVFENQGPTGLRADVMEAIRNTPGISQSDLALGLGANKQTVNYHVKALERAGTIRVEKRGRDTYLFPASAAPSAGQAEA